MYSWPDGGCYDAQPQCKKQSSCNKQTNCKQNAHAENKYVCDDSECGTCKAACVTASPNPCNAPTIRDLVTTTYTRLPNFNFCDGGGLITIPLVLTTVPFYNGDTVTIATGTYTLPTLDYYVRLDPCLKGEARILWPLVSLLQNLISQFSNRVSLTVPTGEFTTTFGYVNLTVNLNVLSSRVIKDPAQPTPIQNTGNGAGGPTVCENMGTWSYNILLAFNGATTPATPVLTYIAIGLGEPNFKPTIILDPGYSRYLVEGYISLLGIPSRSSTVPVTANNLTLYNIFTPSPNTFDGVNGNYSYPLALSVSPAQYISFVPSYDGTVTSTLLSSLNV